MPDIDVLDSEQMDVSNSSASSTSSGTLGLVLFLVLVAVVLILPSVVPFGEGTGGVAPGEPAPQINGAGWINAEAPDQADLSGKVLVLHAWASW